MDLLNSLEESLRPSLPCLSFTSTSAIRAPAMIRPAAERAAVIAPLAVFVEELLVQENQPIQAQQALFLPH